MNRLQTVTKVFVEFTKQHIHTHIRFRKKKFVFSLHRAAGTVFPFGNKYKEGQIISSKVFRSHPCIQHWHYNSIERRQKKFLQ